MELSLFDNIIKKSFELKYRGVNILFCIIQDKKTKCFYNFFGIAKYTDTAPSDTNLKNLKIEVGGKSYSFFTYLIIMNTQNFYKYISTSDGIYLAKFGMLAPLHFHDQQ